MLVPAQGSEREFNKLQFKFLSRVVRYRRKLSEDALGSALDELLERIALRLYETRQLDERLSKTAKKFLRTGVRFCHSNSEQQTAHATRRRMPCVIYLVKPLLLKENRFHLCSLY